MLYRAPVFSVLLYWPDGGLLLEQKIVDRLRLQVACCVCVKIHLLFDTPVGMTILRLIVAFCTDHNSNDFLFYSVYLCTVTQTAPTYHIAL